MPQPGGSDIARTKATGPLTNARLETVFLWTRDFDRMNAFYRDTLGLSIGYQNPHFAAFAAGRCEIALHEEREPHARSDSWHMEFLVDDIESVVTELAHRGVAVSPIQRERFGRIATFQDPEGNVIGLEEPPKRTR